jgi:hypothetical protein
MKFSVLVAFVLLLCGSGCSSYQYAKNVKLVSFDDSITKGKSIGPVEGESCIGYVLGIPTHSQPTLAKAFKDLRDQVYSTRGENLKYINNVQSDTSILDAVFYTRYCIVIKGTGYIHSTN